MNRRSVLRWLGLAPVAAPSAMAAASAPALPPIDYSALATRVSADIELAQRIDTVVARVDAACAAITSEQVAQSTPDDGRPIFLPISARPPVG